MSETSAVHLNVGSGLPGLHLATLALRDPRGFDCQKVVLRSRITVIKPPSGGVRGKAVDTRRPMPNLPDVASHATGTRKLRLCSPVCSVHVTVKQSNARGVEQSIPQIPPWVDLSSVAALPRGASGLGTVSLAKMLESCSSETYCREKPAQLFSAFDCE